MEPEREASVDTTIAPLPGGSSAPAAPALGNPPPGVAYSTSLSSSILQRAASEMETFDQFFAESPKAVGEGPEEEIEVLDGPLSSLPFSQGSVNSMEFKCVANEGFEGLAQYRFLDRKAPFEQSNGHLNFFRGVSKETEKSIQRLYFTDWYHTFLNFKLRWQVFAFMFTYLFLWTAFAGLLYSVNDNCGLKMDSFLDAYYLAIETLETIGYGVPDQYFDGCWEMAVLLSLEAMVTTILNAFLIGVIFSRLSRPQSRASTIVFSAKALIQYNEDGAPHLVFRVVDLRRHQLIEGHIRCYCVLHNHGVEPNSCQRSGLNIYPLRLNQPDDELGGMLLLTAPQFVIHRIDAHSPLSPHFKPKELRPFFSRKITTTRSPNFALQTNVAGCIPQRMSDADTGNRSSFMCEICGSEFSSFVSLKKHCQFERSTHKGYMPRALAEPTDEELKAHWAMRSFEVFCVCEGIEPFTSSTVQSRHSYLTGTDIIFGHSFLPCVRVQPSGICLFDVTRFHKTADATVGEDLHVAAKPHNPKIQEAPAGAFTKFGFDQLHRGSGLVLLEEPEHGRTDAAQSAPQSSGATPRERDTARIPVAENG